MRYLLIIFLILNTSISYAYNQAINLFHNRNYVLWEDSNFDSGYMFTQNGEWQFYLIDEAHNRHVFEWNRLPSEGVYKLSGDTIWLFQKIGNQWEKVRGLLIMQATDVELTIKLLDRSEDWHLKDFDVHLQYLNSDTINIFNSEQWSQTWDPIYQKRSVLIAYSFPVCTLKKHKVKRQLRRLVEETRNVISDTTNFCIELCIVQRHKRVCLIANSLSTFSGKDVWGVLDGMEVPTFILSGELSGQLFKKRNATITLPICMEETKYVNGITIHDICDDYLLGTPIKTICIPLR